MNLFYFLGCSFFNPKTLVAISFFYSLSACCHRGPDGHPSWLSHRPVCGVHNQRAAHTCGGVVHLQEHQTVSSVTFGGMFPLNWCQKINIKLIWSCVCLCFGPAVATTHLFGCPSLPTPQTSCLIRTSKAITWRARSCLVTWRARWRSAA